MLSSLHTVRAYAVLAALLTFAGLAWAKTVTVADTGYTFTVPDSYMVNVPPGAPNILVEAKSPADDVVIQVILGAPSSTATSMEHEYEKLIKPAFTAWKQREAKTIDLRGVQAHYKRYTASASGLHVTMQAIYYVQGDARFVLHAITLNGNEHDALRMLQTFGAGAMPPGNADAITIPGTEFRIAPPAGWRVQDSPDSRNVQFVAPDDQGLLEIGVFPGDDFAGMADDEVVSLLSDEIEKGILADGGPWKRLEDRASSQQGLASRVRRITGTLNDMQVDWLLAVHYGARKVVAIYGMIPVSLRDQHLAAIHTSIDTLDLPHLAGTPNTPATPKPPVTPPTPPATSAATTTVQPHDWDITFAAPTTWPRQTTGNAVIISGPDGVTLTAQRYARADADHKNSTNSANTARHQVMRTPRATLLRDEALTVAGAPAQLLEMTYPGKDAPQRKVTVVVETAGDVYWLGFGGPTEAFHQHIDRFAEMTASVTIDAGAMPLAPTPGFDTFTEPTTGLTFNIPAGWKAAQDGDATSISPSATYDTSDTQILVRVLSRENTTAANLAAANDSLRNSLTANPKSKIVGEKALADVGCPAALVAARVTLNDTAYLFKFVLLELPAHVAVLSFTAPAAEYDAMEGYLAAATSSFVLPKANAAASASAAQPAYVPYTDTAGHITFNVPGQWKRASRGGTTTFTGPADLRTASITVKALNRGDKAYTNLTTAVNTCLAAFPKTSAVRTMTYKTVNGLSAHYIEVGWSDGDVSHVSWYIHVERPGVISQIVVDVHGTVFERKALQAKVTPVTDTIMTTLSAAR